MDNSEVFNQIDETYEASKTVAAPVAANSAVPVMQPLEEAEFGEVSDKVKMDVELATEDKGKVFEIENAEIKRPILMDANKNPIEPKHAKKDPTKVYYESKVVVTFKGTNYVSIIPMVKWFKQIKVVEGKDKVFLNPWFNTTIVEKDLNNHLVSDISKVFYKYCKKKNLDQKKVTQKSFIDGLKGMKVKLEEDSGVYEGRPFARLKIAEFV